MARSIKNLVPETRWKALWHVLFANLDQHLESKNRPEKQGFLVLLICQNQKGEQLVKDKHRATERPSKSSNASHDD